MSQPNPRVIEASKVELPELEILLAAPAENDIGYIRRTWFESFKHAPSMDRVPWPLFKQTSGKNIDQLLARADVKLLAAYEPGGKVLGWCAWSPGKAVSTLHWVYVRHALDAQSTRRRGIATALLRAAELGKRVVYTFHGSKRNRGPALDVTLAEWAKRQGVTTTYAPVEEFLR